MTAEKPIKLDDFVAPPGIQLGQRIGLDTEFVRERTFWPQLALLQIRINGETFLLDPLQGEPSESLLRCMIDAAPTLMHAPGEDLVCLKHRFGWLPGALFDMQLAAAYVGLGVGLGYQALVSLVLAEHVDKGETRSDWLQRPLSDAQLRYAASDVLHLEALHDALRPQLQERGHLDWFEDDCARMLERAAQNPVDLHPHLQFRPAMGLDRVAQARIRRCLIWREAMAEQRDRPRSWMLDNEAVTALAHADLSSAGSVAQVLARRGRAIRQAERELEPLLQAPLNEIEETMPLAPKPDQDLKNQVGRMQQAVADFAERTGLPKEILLARRHLESYALTGEWPSDKAGWRQDELERALAAVRDS